MRNNYIVELFTIIILIMAY